MKTGVLSVESKYGSKEKVRRILRTFSLEKMESFCPVHNGNLISDVCTRE